MKCFEKKMQTKFSEDSIVVKAAMVDTVVVEFQTRDSAVVEDVDQFVVLTSAQAIEFATVILQAVSAISND